LPLPFRRTINRTSGDWPKWGDQGDGTYCNPILPGDYQNTDVVRVNGDYYYISATGPYGTQSQGVETGNPRTSMRKQINECEKTWI
jgi:hypothetical protein